MKCNIGKTERILRISGGIVIILLGLNFKRWWGVIGLVPLITGIIRFCPITHALGISTCECEK